MGRQRVGSGLRLDVAEFAYRQDRDAGRIGRSLFVCWRISHMKGGGRLCLHKAAGVDHSISTSVNAV